MRVRPFWVVLAILVIAVILRPPVAQIGPILDLIQTKLLLSDTETALLAAIPVLCFGFGAFTTPALVRRFGVNKTLVWLLALLFVAIAARPYLGFIGLILGTTLAGLTIAVANVLLPTVVRARFPKKVVPLTAGYTTILAASASFAAAFSYPSAAQFGWQIALELWALPALLALGLSLTLLGGKSDAGQEEPEEQAGDFKLISRSPIAWSIIGLFGIQSLGFYALLAWLPNFAIDSGMNPSDAGALLSLMTVVGVPVGLVLSSNFGRFKNLAPVGAVISMVTIAGLVLLLMHLWVPAVIVIGIGQASSFPLSLSLISTRAGNQRLTTMLSSVSQGVGYLLAAGGTFLFGWLAKVTGNWQVSVIGLIALTCIQVVAAWYAGRPQVIK
jgi:CP family cyanate transporter-like MFS transporter